jgi:uncharacterized protein (TIGR03435 family)
MTRVVGAILAALLCRCANGQSADAHPAFEVASVKLVSPGTPFKSCSGGPGTSDPGHWTCPLIDLRALVVTAYGVGLDQVSGPDWVLLPGAQRYSVAVKIPPGTTKDQFKLMLQNLLAERFHLTLHHDLKDFPAFELVVADTGPMMIPSPPDSDDAATSPGAPERDDKKGFPVLPPGQTMRLSIDNGIWRFAFRATMAEFAEHLANFVRVETGEGQSGDRMTRIVDKTGLTEKFEFTLEYASSVPMGTPVGERPRAEGVASEPAGGRNLFAALGKQLGLKLNSGKKVSLDLLVIDHADKAPTEN